MKQLASKNARRAPTPDEVFQMMAERGYVEEFMENIGICLKAEKWRWCDKENKFVVAPDYTTRASVMKIIAPLMFPAQSQTLKINHSKKSDDTTAEERTLEVAKTITNNLPWFIETAQRVMAEQKGKKQPRAVEVMDVTPEPEPSFEPAETTAT